jgi:hypothetical protein
MGSRWQQAQTLILFYLKQDKTPGTADTDAAAEEREEEEEEGTCALGKVGAAGESVAWGSLSLGLG